MYSIVGCTGLRRKPICPDHLQLSFLAYHPHPKDGEDTVFTGVCLSTPGGGVPYPTILPLVPCPCQGYAPVTGVPRSQGVLQSQVGVIFKVILLFCSQLVSFSFPWCIPYILLNLLSSTVCDCFKMFF